MNNSAAYAKIYHHPDLNEVIDQLLYNHFARIIATLPLREIQQEKLKKSVWLASILASSVQEADQSKAQLFTSLLYLDKGSEKNIENVCYLLMSRLGNLTATHLFYKSEDQITNKQQSLTNFDALLSFELAYQKATKTINVDEGTITATKFQRRLWDELQLKNRLAISAPTSAGKSFITKKHIRSLFLSAKEVVHCLYVVPSRALINQVSDEFRNELNGLARVYTAFLEGKDLDKNSIYVVTPERCLRLLKFALQTDLNFKLIFIDEIQNIEEEKGRGALLEYIAEELERSFPKSQFVIAGPNLTNADVVLNTLTSGKAIQVKTSLSPVIQIRTVIKASGSDHLNIRLLSNIDDKITFDLKVKFNLEQDFKKNIATGLSNVVELFGGNQQSIVYSPRTDWAEIWARHFAERRQNESFEVGRKLTELIDYLKEEIHPKYYLIACLGKGVAFHHSKLPELVRKEIEDCYMDKNLQKLFCTSTLIEGINLPAINLFVVIPKKLNDPLSPFEFGNLIGRAGRLSESLYGNIYCIERQEQPDWASNYFEGTFEKAVVPATGKALNNYSNLVEKLGLSSDTFDRYSELEKNVIIIFRHKFRNDETLFRKYLQSRGMMPAQIEEIIHGISESVKDLQIPAEVCKNNPTIDPILQDRLYRKIKATGIDSWVVHSHPNLRKRIPRKDMEKHAPHELSLYWQLRAIMESLEEIFNIKTETGTRHQLWRSIPQMVLYGVRWIEGQPYSKIIKDDIDWKARTATEEYPFDPNSESDINEVINQLAQINSTIVSHVLVKYLKLLNDILEPLMSEVEREKFKFSLALPGMLELGTTNPIVLQLIASGISRSVALKVNSLFEKIFGHEDMNVFEWLKTNTKLGLKPIYNRYLAKLHLLKDS